MPETMINDRNLPNPHLFQPVDLVPITTILGYLPLDSVTDSVNDLVYYPYLMYI